jgi:hypothetical protein
MTVIRGQRAYDLADAAVCSIRDGHDAIASELGRPLVSDLADALKIGGFIRFTHVCDTGLTIIGVIERRSYDFTWNVHIEDGAIEVLNVVFSTLPTASECEVLRFITGQWEDQLLPGSGG